MMMFGRPTTHSSTTAACLGRIQSRCVSPAPCAPTSMSVLCATCTSPCAKRACVRKACVHRHPRHRPHQGNNRATWHMAAKPPRAAAQWHGSRGWLSVLWPSAPRPAPRERAAQSRRSEASLDHRTRCAVAIAPAARHVSRWHHSGKPRARHCSCVVRIT
jgi:hypothetical protein